MGPTLWLKSLLLLSFGLSATSAWERCNRSQCEAAKPTDPKLVWPGLGFYQSECLNSCLFDGWPAAMCTIAGPCCKKVALARKGGADLSTVTDMAVYCGINPCDKNWYADAKLHMCLKCPKCTITTGKKIPIKPSDCVPDPKCKKTPKKPRSL